MSHTITRQRCRDLHNLYETNYRLIKRLIPDLGNIDASASSHVDNMPGLYLKVLEHTPYTSVVTLTHQFPVGEIHIDVPDLWLRIYHDARVAEVIAHNDGVGPAYARQYTRHQELDRDIKWMLNKFATAWLKSCLKMGHVLLTEMDDLSCQGCIGETG